MRVRYLPSRASARATRILTGPWSVMRCVQPCPCSVHLLCWQLHGKGRVYLATTMDCEGDCCDSKGPRRTATCSAKGTRIKSP